MRIIHAISTLDPAVGGPPQVVVRLAAAQACLGHEVSILSEDGAEQAVAISRMTENVPDFDNVRLIFGVDKLQQDSHISEVDILHVHGVWDAMVRRSTSFARRAGVPYVMMPHGMLDPWSLRQKRWKKWLALKLIYKQILDHAAFLHALNSDEANLIEPLQLCCPVKVIPNGIFIQEINPPPQAGRFRARNPKIGDRPFILFLSRLHYKKGLDILADAFASVVKEYGDVQLVVAGPDDGAQGKFEQQVLELGLSDQVHLVGPLYGGEKLEALRDANCFCLPSRQEGFSVAILEALACGAPVVISDNCHFPEVANCEAGIVVPLDKLRFAESIVNVLIDDEFAKKIGDRGRRLVCETFTWEKIAFKLIDFYNNSLRKGDFGYGK